MDPTALQQRASELRGRYDAIAARKLTLDMTRGKPCPEQLDLSLPMLELRDYRAADGSDCRNYGLVEGLPGASDVGLTLEPPGGSAAPTMSLLVADVKLA